MLRLDFLLRKRLLFISSEPQLPNISKSSSMKGALLGMFFVYLQPKQFFVSFYIVQYFGYQTIRMATTERY